MSEYDHFEEKRQFADKWVSHYFPKDNDFAHQVHVNRVMKTLRDALGQCWKDCTKLSNRFKAAFTE
jgi:hypothetical protein